LQPWNGFLQPVAPILTALRVCRGQAVYSSSPMKPLSPACIFFDLDDTLYPPERGVWREITARINRYMTERMGIPETEVDGIRKKYFSAYGTTLNGLRAEYNIDPIEYSRFVHDVPLDQLLAPDPVLRRMLESFPQKKFIFSNADRPYILRVLARLEIEDCFDGIVDIFSTGFACKPMEASYRSAMQLAGSPNVEGCLLVDDLPRNLEPARKLGMTAVLVHAKSPVPSGDYQIDTIYQLADLIA
jgi:putative hydrolase of the HAD superfamily